MKMRISSARLRLIIWLIIPSVIFSWGIIKVSKTYLTDFFRSTQDEALDGISRQFMYSITSSLNQLEILMMDIGERIASENNDANIKKVMDILGRNRYEYIRGIVYIKNNGEALGYPEIYWEYFADLEKGIIKDSMQNDTMGIFWSSHFYSNIAGGNSFSPVCSVTKRALDENGEKIGTVSIIVDIPALVRDNKIIGGNYEISTLLFDSDETLADALSNQPGKLFPSPVSKEELQNYKTAINYYKKEKLFYSTAEMSYQPNWKIIVIGDVQKLEKRFKPLDNSIIQIMMFCIIGLVCIYIAVSFWFTRPLSKLSRGIMHVGKGDFDHKVEVERDDEFGRVAGEFNRMTSLTKNLIEELKISNEKKRESDFNVLLSQINPHFLYNTLNSIDVMVDISPKAEVHKAFEVLVSLLKYGLKNTNQISTLKEEFKYISDYLYMQNIRYQNRYEFNIIDPMELGELKLLKLLLQPLVENALFHGLHPLKDKKGRVEIEAEREGNTLKVLIRDNGVGIPEDKLNALLLKKDDPTGGDAGGIGLINVHERIQLYYGQSYGLSVWSEVDKGTAVTVKVPVEVSDNETR